MISKKDFTLTLWWKAYLKVCPPLISDWVKKETIFLKRTLKRNSIVLDMGCGWGDDIKSIAGIVKKAVGIENDPGAVKEAKRNLAKLKNVEIFLENAKRMHFKDKVFDYVLCLGNTFGNLDRNKHEALKEMKRVVKKDGKIIISVYSERALPARIIGYTKVDLPIKKTTKEGTIFVKGGIVLEQFSKKKLKTVFNLTKLKVKIKKLNPISYICIATKK